MSNSTNLPFITIEFCPEYAPVRQTVFLLDSGASVNCLRYCNDLESCDSLRILPSGTHPVGASGASLQNVGDCYGTLTFADGSTYRDRFTLIRDLPFAGILGIDLLTNRNFQLLEDGINIKLGNQTVPRVFGPDTIMAIKDDLAQSSCGSRSLSCPLIGSSPVNPVFHKMETDSGSNYTLTVKTPPHNTTKPKCSFLCPVFSVPANCKQWRKKDKEKVTPSRHVGESTRQDSASSNADPEVSLDANQNVRRLLETIDNLKPTEYLSLRETLCRHLKVFSVNDDDLGCFRSTDGGPSKVAFEVRDPTLFIHSVPRRVPYERRAWLEGKLEAMEKNGIIEEVHYSDTSLQVSPIVIVPKKQGKLRMAVDYREINKNLKPSSIPLPHVKDCIEGLAGKKLFSALDITSAFNQVELTDETKDLLGFVTLNKRYRTHRMPFGVLACPGEFQNIVTRTLRFVPKKNVTVYLDDILVHTEDFEEHISTLDLIWTEIGRHGLKLNPLKCDLLQDNIEYLGFKVGNLGNGRYGYQPLESKIRAIQECPLPTTPKEVRQFCGALQYYNNIIRSLNVQLSPLHKGSAKKPFEMTAEMVAAFETVKALLAEEISLTFPDFTKKFTLTTDASYQGAAGILTQEDEDGPQIIYTFSKAFSEVECRWAIVELELLALVWSLEKMRTLLLGRRFTWVTDSLVLKGMIEKPPARDMSRSGRKISRYLDLINEYDFECVHIKGDQPPTAMADFLSRAPIVAISQFFRAQLTKKQWVEAIQKDNNLTLKTGPWGKYNKQLFWEDDLLFLNKKPRARLAVPMSLREPVMRYYHESYTVHGGISRVIQLISPLFIWPDMYADIRAFVNACKICSSSKNKTPQQGVTTAIEVPTKPFEWIQVDLVVLASPKNKSKCKYLLTAICTLTNYFFIQPLERKTGPDVIKALGRLFCCGGIPKIIQSDNGTEFKNSVVQQHVRWLAIEWRFSTPYKPSTQGRVERRHAELSKLMRIMQLNYDNIEEELPYIQFELNSTQDKVSQLSPFEAFHGWEPNVPHVLKDFPLGSHNLHPMELCGELDKLSWEEELRERQERTFRNIREQHHATRYQGTLGQKIEPQLAPGDLVMVKKRGTSKLDEKALGPFTVTRVNRGGTVHVTDVKTGKTQRLPPDLVFRYIPYPKQEDDNEDEEETESEYEYEKGRNESIQLQRGPTPSSPQPRRRPERRAHGQRSLRSLTVPDYTRFY